LTNEELVKEYQEGNFFVLDDLIQQNTGLVKYFAKKFCPIAKNTPLEFDDLEQEGWTGFLDAVVQYQFNNDEPVKFVTYAGMKIKFKILRALNHSVCRKADILSGHVSMCSINAPVLGYDDFTIEDTIKDYRSELDFMSIEEEFDNEILRKDLICMLDSVFGMKTEFNGVDLNGMDVNYLIGSLLNDVNGKDILILHYGLEAKQMPFTEIAKKYCLSASRVQQIEFNAMSKIRRSEQGQALMQKYKWMMVNSLEQEKRQVNQFASPENVVARMETLDELLYGILKQCC
jgi:DNA-directed RNA polymerase sigma subunit (sigma70/sigma32)